MEHIHKYICIFNIIVQAKEITQSRAPVQIFTYVIVNLVVCVPQLCIAKSAETLAEKALGERNSQTIYFI